MTVDYASYNLSIIYFSLYIYDQYKTEYLSNIRAFIDTISNVACKNGVKVFIENTGISDVKYIQEAIALMLHDSSFRLTWDIAHDHSSGLRDRDFLEHNIGAIKHYHIHDAIGKSNHLTLFDGEIDVMSFVERARGSEATVVFETKLYWRLENLLQDTETLYEVVKYFDNVVSRNLEVYMNIQKAVSLRNDGKLKESNELLLELVKIYPKDAAINYQCAWSFDVLEMESEAISYYEKAIELGLPDEDLKEAYLGLGSTYRTLGAYKKSKHVFEKAMERFDDNSLKVFYAMTLYNLESHSNAMSILLKLLAATSSDESIKAYSKAIDFYSDKLDQVFK